MKHPTQQEFYERLNKVDEDDDNGWLIGLVIAALSGSVVGFIIGYFVGRL